MSHSLLNHLSGSKLLTTWPNIICYQRHSMASCIVVSYQCALCLEQVTQLIDSGLLVDVMSLDFQESIWQGPLYSSYSQSEGPRNWCYNVNVPTNILVSNQLSCPWATRTNIYSWYKYVKCWHQIVTTRIENKFLKMYIISDNMTISKNAEGSNEPMWESCKYTITYLHPTRA